MPRHGQVFEIPPKGFRPHVKLCKPLGNVLLSPMLTCDARCFPVRHL